ncbi:type VI secretion system-associated FHA domain protein TagH [Klebsiella aerogenes]|jgi:FHA domain-containing protein|uniref:Type VI secretion system-associated FHA domain protein TagH n=3 Tax=Klebsiella aerogenes TaxID=548 RepID=A0AAJ5JHB0_KLEAE|nr:type VI secretion system-associated FHA domain protein TagH [Klebsiella aerogenes]MCL6718353.1 type VI secretion system-associated FHA domain protein TagH [Klebsiella sp. T2.Ur]AEG98784.1 FHA domain-containing protein [Klebsiella aerogenes KCTC 2190]ATY02555.1 type VI secretion system-associated FHA domain protein TagH [Klebsiella aerogenes]EIW8576759.1 type VI secretion system-associated FHA domain protein TagH [Klebsiella aerogenes]EKM7807894.1 type VI secretion system-associated FHA doma
MRFTIISTKAGHQPPQGSCDFYAPGGTIGRGTDNNLVLPDDDRAISRLQAIVHVAADGECKITNRGNVTRVVLNEIPLERGRQVELQDGDILAIDDYRIEVSDLLQDSQPISRMAASGQPPVTAKPSTPAPSAAPTVAEAAPTAVPSEIWDSLMQEFSIADSISSSRAKPQADNAPNPFAEPKPAERNPEDPLAMFADSEPLFERPPVATDDLFADDTPFDRDSIFADVTPTTLVPPVEKPAQPVADEPQAELDPLALFGGDASAKTARHDDPLGLMGGAPLTSVDAFSNEEPAKTVADEPDAAFDSPLLMAQPPQEPPAAAREEAPEITLPTPQAVARQAAQTPKGRLRIDPVRHEHQATSTPQPGNGEVLQGELLEALLEGMGLGDMQPVPQFDKENMRQLGQMLSMFSQGTVALLSSRSILKRGVKADMTMVLDDANNPFKLLPSGKTVLMQMFGARMPGFMPPKKSVRDALIDLQAHQLGMISGIRAIIAAMLQSFNPEQLEEEAKRDGHTSRLALPASRKAALWDYFVRTYGETAGEIEDDFHTLFGEAFLYAYDMEVNQYKDSQSGSEE